MIIADGWSVTFVDGDVAEEDTLTEGTLEITQTGLVHNRDGRSRLYPWHRVHHIDWVGSEDHRSAIAKATGLTPEEDPYGSPA